MAIGGEQRNEEIENVKIYINIYQSNYFDVK